MISWRREYWPWVALVVVAALAYAWLALATMPAGDRRLFNSPDETANHVFAMRFLETGTLSIPEPLNIGIEDVVHPRSVAVVQDRLVPGGFLGLPLLYGSVTRVIGSWSLVYLTPLLAALTLLALGWLYRQLFGQPVAWAAVLLVASFPAWWYYAARSLFPNLAFTCLVLWAAVAWWKWLATAQAPLKFGIAASILTALAIWIRPSEGVWVLAVLAAVCIALRRRHRVSAWAQVFAVGLLCLLPLLWVSLQTYGVPWGAGYRLPVPVERTGLEHGPSAGEWLLPFGFHPRRAFNRLTDYTVGMFWWLFWPAVAGWVMTLGRWQLLSRLERWYWSVATLVSGYLAVYYGSWQLNDNLDPAAVTLGTSYIRYWLPLYVLLLPYAVIAAQAALTSVRQGNRRAALGLLVGAAMLVSAQLTLWGGEESLTAVAARIREYEAQRAAVRLRVQPDAIILTERHDKVFFPTLPVITQAQTPSQLEAVRRLTQQRPVYYYTWLQPHDVASVAERFATVGLTLGPGERIGSTEQLYPLSASSRF